MNIEIEKRVGEWCWWCDCRVNTGPGSCQWSAQRSAPWHSLRCVAYTPSSSTPAQGRRKRTACHTLTGWNRSSQFGEEIGKQRYTV